MINVQKKILKDGNFNIINYDVYVMEEQQAQAQNIILQNGFSVSWYPDKQCFNFTVAELDPIGRKQARQCLLDLFCELD